MRVYRLLAKFFPREFRQQFESELAADAAELLAAEHDRGRWLRLRLWLGLGVDAVSRGHAERCALRVRVQPRAGSMTSALGVELRQAWRSVAARPGFAAV